MTKPRTFLSLCSLAVLLAAGTVMAAPVRGKIEVELRTVEQKDSPSYLRVRNGFLPTVEPQGDLKRALRVAILSESAESTASCGARYRGGALLPETLIAAPGANIALQNGDGTPYHPSSDAIDGLDGAALAPGHATEFSAPSKPGEYPLHDALYAHLGGRLIVVEGLIACADIEADGSFRFENIEPGEYTVRVFLNGEAVHDTSLIVPPHGSQTITLPPLAL